MDCLAQCAPPSWVAHRSGRDAHPSLGLAKRIRGSALPSPGAIGPGGGGTGAQVRPPSVVFHSCVHCAVPQGAFPSTQPVVEEMNVTDSGLKLEGRGPALPLPGEVLVSVAAEAPAVEEAVPGEAGGGVAALEVVVDAVLSARVCVSQEPMARQAITSASSPRRPGTGTSPVCPVRAGREHPLGAPFSTG